MTITKLLITSGLIIFSTTSFSQVALAQEKNSEIILYPSYREVRVGENFKIDVLAKSDAPLIGGDVKISFDPRVIEVVSIDTGQAFDSVPLKKVEEGKITITAINEREGNLFSGVGRVVTLNLKTIDAGDTSLKVDFDPGASTDSNLTSAEVSDTLAKVDSSTYIVGGPLERAVGSAKRFVMAVAPLFIFLIFAGIVAYVGFRWWKYREQQPKDVFIPRKVPLDKPPEAS
ncbi:MAG: cohesin domain-containing protein [Candidatus Woykebacteria bacterium]